MQWQNELQIISITNFAKLKYAGLKNMLGRQDMGTNTWQLIAIVNVHHVHQCGSTHAGHNALMCPVAIQ